MSKWGGEPHSAFRLALCLSASNISSFFWLQLFGVDEGALGTPSGLGRGGTSYGLAVDAVGFDDLEVEAVTVGGGSLDVDACELYRTERYGTWTDVLRPRRGEASVGIAILAVILS